MDIDSLQARLTLDEEAHSLLTESITGGALDMSILLIGTARQPEIDQAAAFLSARGFDVPVRMVTFTPFLDSAGGVLLAREVEEHEQEPDEESPKARSSRAAKIEWVQERARQFSVGEVVDEHMAATAKLGLRVKPWPKSITIVPRSPTDGRWSMCHPSAPRRFTGATAPKTSQSSMAPSPSALTRPWVQTGQTSTQRRREPGLLLSSTS